MLRRSFLHPEPFCIKQNVCTDGLLLFLLLVSINAIIIQNKEVIYEKIIDAWNK